MTDTGIPQNTCSKCGAKFYGLQCHKCNPIMKQCGHTLRVKVVCVDCGKELPPEWVR